MTCYPTVSRSTPSVLLPSSSFSFFSNHRLLLLPRSKTYPTRKPRVPYGVTATGPLQTLLRPNLSPDSVVVPLRRPSVPSERRGEVADEVFGRSDRPVPVPTWSQRPVLRDPGFDLGKGSRGRSPRRGGPGTPTDCPSSHLRTSEWKTKKNLPMYYRESKFHKY